MSRWRFILLPLTLTGFFLGLMLLPGLDLLFDINPFPPLVENRFLKGFPPWPRTLSEVQQFPGEFDAWLNDHIRFRSFGVRTLNLLKYSLANVSSNPGVVAGKDRFLFVAESNLTYHLAIEPFSESELRRWLEWLEHTQRWLADQGTTFILVIVPSKAGIYPEKLPDWWRQQGKKKRWDQLRDSLTARQSPLLWLDLTSTMLEFKLRGEPVYFRRDSHWTHLGAYYGTMAILSFLELLCESVGKQIPRLSFSDVKSSLYMPDQSKYLGIELVWYDSDYLRLPLVPEAWLERNYAFVPVKPQVDYARRFPFAVGNGRPEAPTAVVFHDSFGRFLFNQLGPHFRWCIFWHYRNGFDPVLLEKTRPDFCLWIMADRMLQNWVPPSN